MEWVRHGYSTTIFRSSAVLCVAWATASLLRSTLHWQAAAKPARIVGVSGRPARRRLSWLFWPFFNLAFMSALAVIVHDGNAHHDWRRMVADDRLWNLAALGVTLALVTYSVVRGAEVRLCSRKPNAEFGAGLVSAALFSWFSPIISVGQKKQLDLDDLPVQARHGMWSFVGWSDQTQTVWDRSLHYIFLLRKRLVLKPSPPPQPMHPRCARREAHRTAPFFASRVLGPLQGVKAGDRFGFRTPAIDSALTRTLSIFVFGFVPLFLD